LPLLVAQLRRAAPMVMIATHSPTLINELRGDEVFEGRRVEGRTRGAAQRPRGFR
jgi:predicted ATPase